MANLRTSLKYGLLTFLLLFVLIQFLPVERTNPPVEEEIPAPPEVRQILQRSCYDCHSNQTRWPWYSRIAPISWLVAHDVQEAREHLNFSTWNRYKAKKRVDHLEEMIEEVEEGSMPLRSYLWLHPRARISQEELALLKAWAQDLALAENRTQSVSLEREEEYKSPARNEDH